MIDIKQAEVKPVKVGEPLMSNVDGNTEPSISTSVDRACVETRRRVCIKCQGAIPEHKYKNAKYCSGKCRNAYISLRYAQRTKIKNPGVGSGGAQKGTANHQYKTGVGSYSQKGFSHYGRQCNRCLSVKHLLVHHRDHDRSNNDLTNLEVLCKGCHQKHHEHRDPQGRYTKV